MNLPILILILSVHLVKSEKCPKKFQPPKNCFDIDEILDYATVAKDLENSNRKYLELLTEGGFVVDETEPGVDLFFSPELTEETQKYQSNGNSIINFLQIAHHHLKKDHGLTGEEILYCIKQSNLTGDEIGICDKQNKALKCPHKLNYQPLDGKCVNEREKLKGAEDTPYGRLMRNSFGDHIHSVRESSNGKELPSPRIISKALRTLYEPVSYFPKENLNNDFLPFYIKIVIFDIAKTLKAQTFDANFGFECCDGKSKLSSRFRNQDCLPIDIPRDDLIYRGQTCMNYIRSMVTHDECEIMEAQVLNTVSHYLDMDTIYDLENVQTALANKGKFPESDLKRIILTGDERVAMLPQLYEIMVIWIKFHNFVVTQLSQIHPSLDYTTLFYESRRFVIAFYQSIFYTEVLPIILSPDTVAEYNLVSSKSCYNAKVDPSIKSEFVASAGRYLHTFLQDSYEIAFKNGTTEKILLRELLYHNFEDVNFMGTLIKLFNSPWNSETVGNEISNYLFSANGPGLDLRALDIQAERDFGVATYCDAIYGFNLGGGVCVESFNDLKELRVMNKENLDFLKYAYEHPCDVDLGVGGSLHKPHEQGTMSEIFDQIFGIQFSNLKCGDPWFYSNALSEDHKVFLSHLSFSDVLCSIASELLIQPFVFLTPGKNNEIKECVSNLDLTGWRLVGEQPVKNEEPEENIDNEDFVEEVNEQ